MNGRPRRTTVDRVALRVPWLVNVLQNAVQRLPSGSKLRGRLVRFAVARATEALNRGDVEACLLSHEPDAEFRFIGWTGAMGEHYQGHQGFRDLYAEWVKEMDDVHWTTDEVIDLGERFVIRYGFSGRGRASGISTATTLGYVISLSPRGKIAQQDMYWEWEKALEAVGLRE